MNAIAKVGLLLCLVNILYFHCNDHELFNLDARWLQHLVIYLPVASFVTQQGRVCAPKQVKDGTNSDALLSRKNTQSLIDFIIEAMQNHTIKLVCNNNFKCYPYLSLSTLARKQ